MNLGCTIHYRKERGWSGKLYYVQMSEKEYRTREQLKLALAIFLGTPLMVFLLGLAWLA